MPAGKVEELYATLKKRNSDIYIQRSKLMYQAAPQRTRLFAWSMTNVEFMVFWRLELSCMSYFFYFQVLFDFKHKLSYQIPILDKDSPWPDEGLEFSTGWCRNISLRCEEWKFQLRDFPQPLLEIRRMYLCGLFAAAEQVAPKRGKFFIFFMLKLVMSPVDR